MKMKLENIKLQSFVTSNEITGGYEIWPEDRTIQPLTKLPCSAIDACPSAWNCPTELGC